MSSMTRLRRHWRVPVAVFVVLSVLPVVGRSGTKIAVRPGAWLITAYCLHGATFTGSAAGPGTIAVDPAVIPLGSRVWVSGYGWGRALDTGAAIVGRHVDTWIASCPQAANVTRYGLVRWHR